MADKITCVTCGNLLEPHEVSIEHPESGQAICAACNFEATAKILGGAKVAKPPKVGEADEGGSEETGKKGKK